MLTRRAAAIAASGLLVGGCGLVARRGDTSAAATAAPTVPSRAVARSPEHQWARTAWRYVENNTDEESGLVGGLDRAPVFTAWNAADALAATIAAYELEVIEEREFDLRLSRLLGFLGTMDLSGGQLPNKAYHAVTKKMVGFDGRPDDIGWSAVDVGRLLTWLRITGLRHPRFREYADKVVLRWSFCDVLDDCGVLHGTARDKGQTYRYQEGRLGYEQVAAAGYTAWGFAPGKAAAMPATELVNIYGSRLAYDARDPRTSGAVAPVLTMPFVLAGIEQGWQVPAGEAFRALGQQVFRLQEERWRRERQFTARSDFQLREAPFVVLDSVYASGYAWNTIASDGREFEKLASVSTRAAFGLWALADGEYPRQLLESVRLLHDPDRGWFEGRFEQGGAPNTTIGLSTNAAVLEVLLFKAKGVLRGTAPDTPGPFQLRTGDPFGGQGRCWPNERGACRG